MLQSFLNVLTTSIFLAIISLLGAVLYYLYKKIKKILDHETTQVVEFRDLSLKTSFNKKKEIISVELPEKMTIVSLRAISDLLSTSEYKIIRFQKKNSIVALYDRKGFFEFPSQHLKVFDSEFDDFVASHSFSVGQEVKIHNNNIAVIIDQITQKGLYSCSKSGSDLKLGDFADFEIEL